jgi:MFS family permease
MSNNNKSKVTVKFPSVATLLGIAFIILKLCDVITWSWVWILSPFWIGAIISILSLIVALIGVSIAAVAVDKFKGD